LHYTRVFKGPEKASYFLFGPRGTGKSTWLREQYTNALWVDLLRPAEERAFSMKPELLTERLLARPDVETVVIDEVQKVPKILDEVHHLIESRKDIQFILTGSSSRKLRRGGVNLLAGRALWKNFHPFIACELGENFQLEAALKTGMIPLVYTSSIAEESLEAYVDLYLQEEVKAEALVRQVGEFSRFLYAMAYSHGCVLNITNVSRECEVARKTVESYLHILQDLLLGYTVPVFEKRAQRLLTAHPKFYFFDPGVFRVLKKSGFADLSTEAEGAALEGLVAEHLRAWIDVKTPRPELYFWRTRAGTEVDFIICGQSCFYAIEVKNGGNLSPHDLRGLKEFQKDFPEAKAILLYRGLEIIQREGILCVPAQVFLKKLHPYSENLFGSV
jgi:predicted AAA+ superfamily ATPase